MADNIIIKDGAGATPSMRTTDAGGAHIPHHIITVGNTPVASANPLPVSSRPGTTVTQTVVTLTANTSTQLIAANSSRRYLAIVNIGTGLASLGFAGSATVNAGFPLPGAPNLGDQGGGVFFEGSVVPVGAIHGISAAGTTIVILEG